MSDKRNIDRRFFLRTAGTAGFASLFAAGKTFAEAEEPAPAKPEAAAKPVKPKLPSS